MLVLGIETSCDETAVSIVEDGERIISQIVSSQAGLHARYGGVVPEIAARAHTEAMIPVIEATLNGKHSLQDMDLIAVTCKPGLIGALLIGLSAAKAISWAQQIPLVGVDHIHAHAYSCMFSEQKPEYPYVALIASGGHTSLYMCRGPLELEEIGCTLDDAAGEAFDKVSSILELEYPGGPSIEKAARNGNAKSIRFPKAALKPESERHESIRFNFSFSGLKTAVLYHCYDPKSGKQRETFSPDSRPDIAASFQQAAVDSLVSQTVRAALHHRISWIAIGGGVAANLLLRQQMAESAASDGIHVTSPPQTLCTDNATMIAGLGFHMFNAGLTSDFQLDATP